MLKKEKAGVNIRFRKIHGRKAVEAHMSGSKEELVLLLATGVVGLAKSVNMSIPAVANIIASTAVEIERRGANEE